MSISYSFLRILMRFALLCFFRKVKVEGLENIPKDTPIIIAPNHQNALIDALLAVCFLPPLIHFLTRSDVFNKWTNPLLSWMKMMPIYRIRDGYSKLSQNDAVFEACREIFKKSKSVLIFPEGNHGEHHFLRPLTKGTSRLAFQSQEHLEQALKVVPIGINYFSHRNPRSTVLIAVGKPIEVNEYLAEYRENNPKGLMSLRDRISEGMKETLVIPDETEDYIERRDAIFSEENSHLSFAELKGGQFESPNKRRRKSKHLIAKILNPVPFMMLHKVIGGIKDKVFYSTMKFGVGVVAFPIWWLIVLGVMSFFVGIKIAALTVAVMVMGLFFSYRR